MSENKVSIILPPKVENVEYWTFVSNSGQQVTYMLRIELGEKAQVLTNPIDQTPVEVQLLLKDGTDKNEMKCRASFPIVNLFSYACETGTHSIYPEGHSPADQQLKDIQDKQRATLQARKVAFEARIGAISDLSDGPSDL